MVRSRDDQAAWQNNFARAVVMYPDSPLQSCARAKRVMERVGQVAGQTAGESGDRRLGHRIAAAANERHASAFTLPMVLIRPPSFMRRVPPSPRRIRHGH